MAARYTCRLGHHWQPGADDPSASRPPMACPVCGAVATLTPDEELAVVRVPAVARAVARSEDPNATIAAEDSSPPPRRPTDEPTLGSAGEIAPALRSAVPGYEILEEVGRGGMGVVYKARDERLNRLVALKMILAGLHVGPRELVRFRAEAAAVAGLQHPNIVQIYEVGEHEGRPYLALEFVSGGSLAEKLTGAPMPPRWAAELIESLARAVQHAHQRNIVHRDLKPANILMGQVQSPKSKVQSQEPDTGLWTLDFGLWTPKLTDFGLAKHLAASDAMTQSGTVLGTPSYMAPEQALGKNRAIGPASDIYALGAILYELLTGRPPFRAETALDTMLQAASEEAPPISRLQPRVPRDLQTVCQKCLAKEPHKRYSSAEALADDLHRFLTGEPIQARPVGTLERAYKWARRRPSLAALILLALGSVVLAFIGLTWMYRLEAEQVEKLKEAENETQAALARAEVSLYCNRIALAEREWLANNVPRARQLLAECPHRLRQWEWHYLNHLCHGDLLTLRVGDSPVAGVAFDDHRHLAVITEDQALRVWDTDSGKAVFSQREASARDRGLVLGYAPGGQLHLASASQPIRVWDIGKRDKPTRLRWPQGWAQDQVALVALGPDRHWLAAGLKDGTISVWDVVADKEVFHGRGHKSGISCIAISADHKLIASGDQAGNVIIWDVTTGKELEQLPRQARPVRVLAFSPDGQRLASASGDPLVRVWEAATGNLLFSLRGHAHPVYALAFAPSGRFLASGGLDQMVKVWDTVTGEEAFTLRGHTHQVLCLSFSPDGRLLASASRDQSVRVWDATTGQEARALPGKFASHAVAFRPDGKRLATAEDEVTIWDANQVRYIRSFGGPTRRSEALAYRPDGRQLAVSGHNGLSIWDPVTKEELQKLGEPKRYVRGIAYHPDGKLLAAAEADGSVTLWDPLRGEVVRTLRGHSGAATAVAFSPDGSRLASGGRDHDVKVWDVASGDELYTLHGHSGAVRAVAFGPKGDVLASGAVARNSAEGESPAEGELKVWDVRSGELRHNLWGHTGEVTCVAFSPDGARLASGSDDHTVKVWDPVLAQEVLTLRGHTSMVLGVAFSPDGTHLASTGADQTVRLWNGTPQR